MESSQRHRAWYAIGQGRWRDWLNLLHLPYTLWHLSYAAVGAGLAARVDGGRLAGTLVAFALAVGVAAHALDELRGRPLGTAIGSRSLVCAAAVSITAAAAIGVVGVFRVGWELIFFVLAGVVLVTAYNLELLSGRLHTDWVFAASWGAFPVLTGFYSQAETITVAPVLAAVFAFAMSWAQRVLSTESRSLRRSVVAVEGEKILRDGSRNPVDLAGMLRPIDRALRALSWSMVALGAALLVSRMS